MKNKYALALQRNARTFIESSVEHAERGYGDSWKFAVLHLHTALELLLKARLAMVDHRHLVAGKAQVTDRQFDEGAFRSVGIEECLDRLASAGRLILAPPQKLRLEALQRLRNRIAHYIEPDDTPAMKAMVAAGLNLFIELHDAGFRSIEDPYGATPLRDLVVDLQSFDGFIRERLAAIAPVLNTAKRPRTHYLDECAWCLQDAAIIDGDSVRCLFCGHAITLHECAELKSDDHAAQECPDCGQTSVIRSQWKDREPTYDCLVCGYFRGPETKWSDGKAEIPRLHADR